MLNFGPQNLGSRGGPGPRAPPPWIPTCRWKDIAQELDVSWKQRNDVREENQYGFIQMLCWFSQPQGCIIQWINLIGWMNLHHATDPWPSILVCSLLACLSVSDVVDTLYTDQVAGQQVNLIPCNYDEGRSGCNLSYRGRRPPGKSFH